MPVPADTSGPDLASAHEAASVLLSDHYRPYLPGRVLPGLLEAFRDSLGALRDNAARTAGMPLPLPALPRQAANARKPSLDELTTSEFAAVHGAVETLAVKFTAFMADPELPRELRGLRDALLIEHADRAGIAESIGLRAKAS